MRLHTIEIQLYADSEEQAAQAAAALNGFVRQLLSMDRAVTAPAVTDALDRWQGNALVRNRVVNHFPKIKRR